MRRWWFSLVLLAGYVATFEAWHGRPRTTVVVVTLAAVAGLGALFLFARRSSYFLNAPDVLWHAAVLLDLAVEGLVVSWHGDRTFYLCAAAFVIVVGGYRARGWRRVDARARALCGPPAAHTMPTMQDETWQSEFRAVFQRGVAAWQAGRRSPDRMFDARDAAFLEGIGCTAQEMFDFVDDYLGYGEPGVDEALEIQALRRDYLVRVMAGKKSGRVARMADLPPKAQEVDGIAWLPRLIVKARLKLRGEMPADLMYGCGGDRPFVRRMNTTLADFLRLVREHGDDDRTIVESVKRRAGLK
ncbi:MAG: DUF5069 domain-containing protein [Limisphaerales bacterium]